jgi:putative flippase GtrA
MRLTIKALLNRERVTFLGVGISAVLIDYGVYFSLLSLAQGSVDIAKALGFLSGAVFAYWANRKFTFQHEVDNRHSLWRFCLVYALSLFGNIALNNLSLGLLADLAYGFIMSFVIATGFSAVFNYLGMKFFVFRAQ